MRSATSVTLYLSGTSLVVAMFASGCAMFEPRAEAYVPPPVGSSWTVSFRNTGSFGKDAQRQITRGDGTWQGSSAIALKSSNGMTTMATESGQWMALVAPNGKPFISWEPAIGFEFPLYVGKSWTKSYRMTLHAKQRTVTYESTCKVEGYGDVSVPAGTFKAFEIGCSDTIGTATTFWYSPDLAVFLKTNVKRDANSPFGPGTQQAELVAQNIKK